MNARRILLSLLAALLTGWTCLIVAPVARAGGPTSVLVTNPATQQASGLYCTDPEYDVLFAAVNAALVQPAAPSATPGMLSRDAGREVRLTWMIHDMSVWRVDRIHLTSSDGVWIETVADVVAGGDVFEQTARWSRPRDEQALHSVLRDGGVLSGPTVTARRTASNASAPTTSATTTPVAVPALTGSSQSSAPTGLLAVGTGLAGLVVGVALSLLRRSRPGRRDGFVLTG